VPNKQKPKIEYANEPELTEMVTAMLANQNLKELQTLYEHQVIILCCARVCMDENGETMSSGAPVKLKKLSEVERVFVADHAHYIVVVDYHWWKTATERQKLANLFDHLMTIKPEAKEDGLALKKREPSIGVKYAETLAYFGPYDEPTLLLRDAVKGMNRRLVEFVDDIGAAAEAPEPVEPEPEPAGE
jgi:hypothetical protein